MEDRKKDILKKIQQVKKTLSLKSVVGHASLVLSIELDELLTDLEREERLNK